jgi:hypothetical protein
MHRQRLLHTLYVACPLLCASLVFVVQNGSACSWQAELFDYTTQETTRFAMEATPVKIPLVNVDKGMDVHCSLDPSEVLSIGILKQQKVDIVCRYPDDQMLTARALTIFDIFTGEVLTHPVTVFFSNARKYNETLYKLHVDCQ